MAPDRAEDDAAGRRVDGPGSGVTEEDRRLGEVRDQLRERYLGFRSGGLSFVARDISAEIAEARRRLAEFLGREPRLPDRPSRLIHLWVVTEETGEIVGNATREVGLRGSALVVAHKQLRIRRPQWRRRGFGSALLAENRGWYRECGVESIVMEAEGDGSAFAAARGFDFDVTSYAQRPGFHGLAEPALRHAVVDRLMHHPAVQDVGEDDQAPRRESVSALLRRLTACGGQAANQVAGFRRRLPSPPGGSAPSAGGEEPTFTAPAQIAAFGRDEPLDALNGQGLGRAVLARTGWSGIFVL